jgi:hypothetical protein
VSFSGLITSADDPDNSKWGFFFSFLWILARIRHNKLSKFDADGRINIPARRDPGVDVVCRAFESAIRSLGNVLHHAT